MVEIARIQHAMDRYGRRFLDRVYLDAEKAYCLRKRKSAESFAARFAAKEAAAKALGTGISYGVSWLEIEVVRAPSGKPGICVFMAVPRKSPAAWAWLALRSLSPILRLSPWPASCLKLARRQFQKWHNAKPQCREQFLGECVLERTGTGRRLLVVAAT